MESWPISSFLGVHEIQYPSKEPVASLHLNAVRKQRKGPYNIASRIGLTGKVPPITWSSEVQQLAWSILAQIYV
jgi:hypothetical protein